MSRGQLGELKKLRNDDGELRGHWRIVLCGFGLVVVAAISALLYPALEIRTLPVYKGSNPLFFMFDKTLLVSIVRTGAVVLGSVVAIYLLFSVFAHIWTGRWIIAWGTAKTAREVENVKRANRRLRAELKTANDVIAEQTRLLGATKDQVRDAMSQSGPASLDKSAASGTMTASGGGGDD